MKKFFAIFLSLVMIMSLGVPAFAADNTSKDVTASYTPSSTEDTTATITGVSITVDGTTYDSTNTSAENPAIINSETTSISLTVTGTNLKNATADNYVHYCQMVADTLSDDGWTFGEDGTSATRDFSSNKGLFESTTTAFELEYCNDYTTNQTWTGSGVYVIYDSGSTEDTTTLPNPLYFKAEGATSVNVSTYNSSGALTANADNEDTFTMTAVAGETGIFSVDTANFSAETVKVAFAGNAAIFTAPIDLPTDGSNMYDYDNSEWITYTPSSTEDTTKTIYFDNTGGWETVYAFVWNDSGEYSSWPGTAMTLVNGETSIYSIEVPTADASVVFNNGAGEQTADLTIPTGSENLYTYSTGVWSVYGQGSTEDTATITGVSITVDGVEYTRGETATITPNTTSITLTVTGTNLQNGTVNNWVAYANGYTADLSYRGFEINANGTTATLSIDANEFANTTTVFQIKYSNDGGSSWTGSGVYVIYGSGSTEDTTAKITGVSITVDGVEYNKDNTSAENPAIINSDTTSIILTVTGTNLNNSTADNLVIYAYGSNITVEASYGWTFADDGSEATFDGISLLSDFISTTAAFEIEYSNDGGESWIGTGVYVINDNGGTEDTKPAKITGVTITVDGVEYTSGETATITPKTTSIIITVTGTNLQNGTNDNYVHYASGHGMYVTTGHGWNFIDDGTATLDVSKSLSYFAETTTAFEIEYCNDFLTDATWTGSGVYVIYQSESVSVDITWGAMSFTYDDTVAEGETEETGWTCADGANKITVSNNGTVTVCVEVTYTAADNYTEITGKFDAESATLAENESQVFTLSLDGKPNAAIAAGTKIGSVTVTIKASNTAYIPV